MGCQEIKKGSKGVRIRRKSIYLLELPYTEMGKSATIRLASVGFLSFYIKTNVDY